MIRAILLVLALALFGCTRTGSDPGFTLSSSDPGHRAAGAPADPATAGSVSSDGSVQSEQAAVALNTQDCIQRVASGLLHSPLLQGDHIDKQTVKDQLTLQCGQAYIDWTTQHQVQQPATSITQVDGWEEFAYDSELAKSKDGESQFDPSQRLTQ